MERFHGYCQEFATVEVSAIAAWVAAIPLEEWPQQTLTELKPSMVTSLTWKGFGLKAIPIMHGLGFDESQWFQPMLSVVMPGHHIEAHKDQQAEYWLARVHVPLLTNESASLIMDDGEHHLEVGKAYLVNTMATHAVSNGGSTPRIHFMFDVRA